MAAVYAKEVFENPSFYDTKYQKYHKTKNIQYTDFFRITVDGFKVNLRWYIDNKNWTIALEDLKLYDNQNDCLRYEHFTTSINSFDISFPEFASCKDSEITLEILTIFFERMYELLKNLSFNKQMGMFITQNVARQIVARRCFLKEFMENEEKCCVCLDDEIQTKTPCNHTVCFPCWSNLTRKKCPICRDEIIFVDIIDNDDDD
jgi:hypothetical protein